MHWVFLVDQIVERLAVDEHLGGCKGRMLSIGGAGTSEGCEGRYDRGHGKSPLKKGVRKRS